MIRLDPKQFAVLSRIAEKEAGLYMPDGKATFVASRLQRRLRQTGLEDFDSYIRLVSSPFEEGRMERVRFISALTTNVTSIYREPHHFRILAGFLRTAVEHGDGKHRKIHLWSAGCSSGEEPLSMAATCQAVLGSAWTQRVEILATDVDETILAVARERCEDDAELAATLAAVPVDTKNSVVELSIMGTRFLKKLQSGIKYRQQSLMHDMPDNQLFDVIFCRNVTIYFSRNAQESVHRKLRSKLSPNGILALGHSERLLDNIPPMTLIGRTIFQIEGDAMAASRTKSCL